MFRTALVCIGLAAATQASAQSWQMNSSSYALKEGETQELMDLYWVVNCRSQLTAPPEVMVLDGPPGVTASVSEAMVTPRLQQCAKAVKGGKLMLKADKVEDQSNTMMTIRLRYPTKDGVRERSLTFSLALFPS